MLVKMFTAWLDRRMVRAWFPVSTGDMAYSLRSWKVNDDIAVRLFDQRASSSMEIA
jgi:hypothetical protein